MPVLCGVCATLSKHSAASNHYRLIKTAAVYHDCSLFWALATALIVAITLPNLPTTGRTTDLLIAKIIIMVASLHTARESDSDR